MECYVCPDLAKAPASMRPLPPNEAPAVGAGEIEPRVEVEAQIRVASMRPARKRRGNPAMPSPLQDQPQRRLLRGVGTRQDSPNLPGSQHIFTISNNSLIRQRYLYRER